MAGEVPISGLLSTNSPLDVYAVIDPLLGVDGLRSVSSSADMLQIPLQRQRVGMLVYVQSDGVYYKLTTASAPPMATYEPFSAGGASITQSFNEYTGSFSGSTFIGPMTGTFYIVTQSFEVTNSYNVEYFYQYSGSFSGSFTGGSYTGSFYSVSQSVEITNSFYQSYSGSFSGSVYGPATGNFYSITQSVDATQMWFKDMISGQIEFPVPSNVMHLVNYAPNQMYIDGIFAATWLGSSSLAVTINGSPVAGLSFIASSSAGQMVTASNTSSAFVQTGSSVEMAINPSVGSERLTFTLLFRRRVDGINA